MVLLCTGILSFLAPMYKTEWPEEIILHELVFLMHVDRLAIVYLRQTANGSLEGC
jgi:hypothetical protein